MAPLPGFQGGLKVLEYISEEHMAWETDLEWNLTPLFIV